jgi:hypothetical protein
VHIIATSSTIELEYIATFLVDKETI